MYKPCIAVRWYPLIAISNLLTGDALLMQALDRDPRIWLGRTRMLCCAYPDVDWYKVKSLPHPTPWLSWKRYNKLCSTAGLTRLSPIILLHAIPITVTICLCKGLSVLSIWAFSLNCSSVLVLSCCVRGAIVVSLPATFQR